MQAATGPEGRELRAQPCFRESAVDVEPRKSPDDCVVFIHQHTMGDLLLPPEAR